MNTVDEITENLRGSSRAIAISEKEVDLRPEAGDNTFFLLMIGEGSLAAGGRGGGFGERKVTAVRCYQKVGGVWRKTYDEQGPKAAEFEVPFHVSRLPLTLSDGTESMGYGVVDPELVVDLLGKCGISSA